MGTKVMTFNLRMDTPDDGVNAWVNRVDKVANIINQHNPAIIGVQEAFHHMLIDLEEFLPNYRWVGEGRLGGNEDEFSAIFYDHKRIECLEHGQFWLSEEPSIPRSKSWDSALPRICTWGRFKLKEQPSKIFTLFNTHLDHMGIEARNNGIHLIAEKIKASQVELREPIILTGDFNSHPWDLVVQFLKGIKQINRDTIEMKDAFDQIPAKTGSTYHGFSGGEEGDPIDYIFCSSEVEILETIVDRSAIDGSYPSDHYPVISKLKL